MPSWRVQQSSQPVIESNVMPMTKDIARRNNLTPNRNKCQFGVKELVLFGDVIGAEGMKPDPKKSLLQ